MAMAIGIVFIAVAFYPVVRRHNEAVALLYLISRAIECVLLLGGPIVNLYLAGLSKESTGGSDTAELTAVAAGYSTSLVSSRPPGLAGSCSSRTQITRRLGSHPEWQRRACLRPHSSPMGTAGKRHMSQVTRPSAGGRSRMPVALTRPLRPVHVATRTSPVVTRLPGQHRCCRCRAGTSGDPYSSHRRWPVRSPCLPRPGTQRERCL